jgi:viroplasmin and RNaseH domain-containing protein
MELPMSKLKQFLVFAWEAYEESGGWNDFHDSFDTLEEAKDYCESIVQSRKWTPDCFQVISDGVEVYSTHRKTIEKALDEKNKKQTIETSLTKLEPILKKMEISELKIKQIAWLSRNLQKIKGDHPDYVEAKTLLDTLVKLNVHDVT